MYTVIIVITVISTHVYVYCYSSKRVYAYTKSVSGNADSAAFARLNTSVSNVLPLRLLFPLLFPPVCGLIFKKTLKEVH